MRVAEALGGRGRQERWTRDGGSFHLYSRCICQGQPESQPWVPSVLPHTQPGCTAPPRITSHRPFLFLVFPKQAVFLIGLD